MADLLTETYERIRLRLKAGAGRLLSDADAAEDALQDAFVRLWGRYRVGSEREAEALLTRTVRNVSIDQLRKRKTVPLDGDLAEEESGMDRETQFRRVEKIVEQELTELQRLIVRKHEYEGLTLEALAQELVSTMIQNIQPRRVTVDLMTSLSYRGLGLRLRYNPVPAFSSAHGPEFRTWCIGAIVEF